MRIGALPQIKRLYEYIEESYFDYLKNLHDLVILMDEWHHYRADAGIKVLNELDTLLVLELISTPQVETSKGAVKFRNAVYEYSLAQAIGNFVKIPWVVTKRGFCAKTADQFAVDEIKLTDGIVIHRNTKADLETSARNEGVRIVKPFVLVVCKDTVHVVEVMDYIKSVDFLMVITRIKLSKFTRHRREARRTKISACFGDWRTRIIKSKSWCMSICSKMGGMLPTFTR